METTADDIRAEKTIAVIDGNSLLHRAFHAVPPTMSAPDGRPTNACFGFIGMLLKLIDEFAPNAIVCAFDAGIPEFRMVAIEQYKAQRPPTDPLLKEQFPMIQKLLEAMDIPVVRIQGWEGDDILGTLSAMGEKQSMRTILVSGDRDVLQLVSDQTSVLTTKKGLSDVIIYTPDEVFDRYGVTPQQVPDYLGLKGDTSDNIPGVPGIGEKSAAGLLQKYGSLDGVYEHADEVKGKMGENLRANRQSAYDSQTVATIHRDVPIDIDLQSVAFPSFDPETVKQAFSEVRFSAHLKKVLSLEEGAADAVSSPADRPEMGDASINPILVTAPLFEDEEARRFLDSAIAGGELVGAWIGSQGEGMLETAGDLYCATRRGVAIFSQSERDAVIARLFREAMLSLLDSKAFFQVAFPPDSSEKAELASADFCPERTFDVSIAAYLLASQRKSYAIESIVEDYLEIDSLPDEQTTEGATARAASLAALAPVMLEALNADESRKCFDEIEMPLVPVLARMERTGVDLDTPFLEDLGESTQKDIDALRTDIYRMAGEEFNIDSPKQLGTVLFDKLKLRAGKKTKTGYSTDARVLADLAQEHPLPGKVIEYRELAKIKSTYIDALPKMLKGDGRLHTSFNQYVTATGRLSSSDPNLQNIPVRTDFGRQIREAFRPKGAGEVFLSADYSQIELRLLAHCSGDQGLIDAFISGNDFHTATAARVFGVPIDKVDQHMRSRAKAVNFGIVYGQQAFGLSQSLKIPFSEAQEMIDRYFEAYPGVRAYLDQLVATAKETGVATTMFGRKRRIDELLAHNPQTRAFGERTAMNHPMQGSAADIIKLAMIRTEDEIAKRGLSARFVLQVHDELDFECPQAEVEELGPMVKEAMEGVADLKVPLIASISYGPTWADAK